MKDMERVTITARVELKDAERAKNALLKLGIVDSGREMAREGNHFLIPLVLKPPAKLSWIEIARKRLPLRKKAQTFQEALAKRKILTASEAQRHKVSFDIVGDIALIEVPEELSQKERAIAGELLKFLRPRIRTVAKKTVTSGEYRVRKIAVLAGGRKTATDYAESGCVFGVDLNRAYFNPRLSYERERIASLVKKGENVLVLFAGVGPFPVVIGKKNPQTKIIAIEINPDAVEEMRGNVERNGIQNVEVIEGDVKRILGGRRFSRWADRVVMPLPHNAVDFLPEAICAARKGGTIHLYSFASELEKDMFSVLKMVAKGECERQGRKSAFLSARKVLSYAPRVAQIVVDFKVD
ncbi:class I SAM-dependent methyltransferase family protein [Candidatus Micrarchaeota archaeon]|nr:class I SAM-dependent methyltransferase family protein [Candidatus Micrarchaeota archaeon]